MAVDLLLAHGDDGLSLDDTVAELARALGDAQPTVLVPDRSPDEAILDRARVESASVGLFGAHLVVLRQPLRAAGRSGSAGEKLIGLVRELPDGAALALVEVRPSRDATRPPALLRRLADAVRERGGRVDERFAPRRAELAGWTRERAVRLDVAIEPAAARLLAERVGGAIWETDVERGEQTRVVDSELRKLATFAGERPISADDVERLTADTRPASVFAVTNAIDRREPAAAATALRRALDEGQPVLRITASIHTRLADLIVAHDLLSRGATPAELTRRVGRGSARGAQRIAEAARRYRPDELATMLQGLFEADLAIKSNQMDPEAAISAWLGEHLLATRSSGG